MVVYLIVVYIMIGLLLTFNTAVVWLSKDNIVADSHVNLLFKTYQDSTNLQQVSSYLNLTQNFNDTEFCIDMDPCFFSSRPNKCITNMNNWYRKQWQLWDRPKAGKVQCFDEHGVLKIPSHHHIHLPFSQHVDNKDSTTTSLQTELRKNQSQILTEIFPKVNFSPVLCNTSHLEIGSYCFKQQSSIDANVPDCTYEVDLVEYSIGQPEPGLQTIMLRIQQHSCSFNTIQGASSFDIFIRNEFETSSCSVADIVDNQYFVRCTIAAATDCVRMTLTLQYEHFDALSGMIHEWINRFRELAYVILDDHLVCKQDVVQHSLKSTKDGLSGPNSYSKEAQIHWQDRFDISKYKHLSFFWHGGRWLNQTTSPKCSIRSYFRNQSNVYDSMEHSAKFNSTLEQQILTTPQHYLPFHSVSLLPPKSVADHFQFHPDILHQSKNKSEVYTPRDGCEVNDFQPLTLIPKTYYLMIGSSHMRYSFDIAVQYFYGVNGLQLSHYHKVGDIGALHFNQSHFTHEAVTKLHYHCEMLEQNRSIENVVLVVQTSAWDLSVAAIRHLIRSPIGYRHLVNTIKQLLNRTLPCGNLIRIIWITPMPHNLCTNHADSHCSANRGHRNSQSTEAIASIYLQSLFDALLSTSKEEKKTSKPPVKLHIIDAYSIISPRLVYREDREVVCMNHYTCTNHNPAVLGPGVASIITPGGFAVLRSLFLAMSSEFSSQTHDNDS